MLSHSGNSLEFFFLAILMAWHEKVLGPSFKPMPQLWPEPLQWQCQILNPLSHMGTSLEICLFFIFRVSPSALEVPGLGLNWSCSRRPMPGPQPLGIGAMSVTYTTVHGNTRSLTHWARPGIEPPTSWFLDSLTTVPRWELLKKSVCINLILPITLGVVIIITLHKETEI